MTDVIKLFYNGREEALQVVNTGGDLIKYLSRAENPICPLIGTKISLEKKLGEGKSGKVFQIEFPGSERRGVYVAKESTISNPFYYECYFPDAKMPCRRKGGENLDAPLRYKDICFSPHVDRDYVFQINGVKDVDEVIPPAGIILAIPTKEFVEGGCSTLTRYPRLDGKGYTYVPPRSFLCDEEYTEFALAILVGDIYRKGVSINFIDTFYFAICPFDVLTKKSAERGGSPKIEKVMKKYIFMEKIDKTLRKTAPCLSSDYALKNQLPDKKDLKKQIKDKENLMNGIVIQLLHAICVYQNLFSIVHGDLHDDNVLLEFVTPNTIYQGQNLAEADYYEYRVGETLLYIPASPVIVKIADWGLSVKYASSEKDNMIGNEYTMKTGYQQKIDDPWLPNFYTKAYDPVFILTILQELNSSNSFIKNITAWMYGLYHPKQRTPDKYNQAKARCVSLSGSRVFRPLIEALTTTLAHVTPERILTNEELVGRYMMKPPGGSRVAILGVI